MDLNRRDLLRRLGGLTLAPTLLEQTLAPLNLKAAGKVTPRGTARNVIFIALNGAISQVDCWDFKETRFTPADLKVSEVQKGLYLPKTLVPSAGEWAPKTSFVRSMKGTELVHFVGQYHLQVGKVSEFLRCESSSEAMTVPKAGISLPMAGFRGRPTCR